MSGKQQKTLVPRLRFPEFRDAGAWEAKRLGELTNRITERIDSKKLTPVSITSGAGFVSQAEKFGRDISGRQYEKYIVLKEGQFSYNKGNSKTFPQGAIYQLREFKEAAVPNAFYSFEFKDDYVPEFFRGYFEKNFHGHQLVRFITSGARSDGLLNIGANDFFSIVLPTPRSRAEQQKIADCLSSLDELIELQSQKVEALRRHKKGLMQQLFPREGETTPRLRFPEFHDAGEWEVKKLAKLIDTVTPPKKLKTSDYLDNGNFPVIDQSQDRICGWTNDEEAIIMDRLPLVIFGDHTCTIKIAKQPFAQGADGIKILAAKENVDPFFLYQFLLFSPIEQKQYKRHFSTLKEKPVYFPPKKLGEQQKIADCLSSLDDLIELQSQKVEALKQHKKGLMQQMFPNGEL